MQEYFAYTTELRDSGKYVDGDALQPTSTAKTVTSAGVTDGPFAETKEQLGGYYMVEVDTEDEALEWAAKIPSARYGKIEVRPVMVFDRAGGHRIGAPPPRPSAASSARSPAASSRT